MPKKLRTFPGLAVILGYPGNPSMIEGLSAIRGEKGRINSTPCPENPTLRVPLEIEEKILYLRKTYPLGQVRVSWVLERYPNIKVSARGGCPWGSETKCLNRQPRNTKTRTYLPPLSKADPWPSCPEGGEVPEPSNL